MQRSRIMSYQSLIFHQLAANEVCTRSLPHFDFVEIASHNAFVSRETAELCSAEGSERASQKPETPLSKPAFGQFWLLEILDIGEQN